MAAISGKPVSSGDLQENLRRLDRLANLGLVSAGLAHEIKNGLVSINVFVDLLLQKGEEKEMALMAQRELRRIDMLATQMLRYASPKARAFSEIHAHEILDQSLRLLDHQTRGNLIMVEREYEAGNDLLNGSESQLQQAFMNLLLNAVEAMSSNGCLKVRTENEANPGGLSQLRITIRDSGSGILPENLERLFEPFFTTKKNGTGLGLSITRRIVEEHSGAIEVQSETGRGSAFILTLPTR